MLPVTGNLYREYYLVCTHQWNVTLWFRWLITWTIIRSSSLTMIFGPGNSPFTVGMLLVLQSLVTFSNLTYKITEREKINIFKLRLIIIYN